MLIALGTQLAAHAGTAPASVSHPILRASAR
jgi:hypothetical protein